MSTPEENKKLVKTLCKTVFQKHNFSKLDEIMRDDYIQHNEDTPQGKAGFKQFFEQMFKAMPDFSYTMKKIIAEGDTVMMYSTTTATHKSEWLGNPATGNKLNFDVIGSIDPLLVYDGPLPFEPFNDLDVKWPLCGDPNENLGRETFITWERGKLKINK